MAARQQPDCAARRHVRRRQPGAARLRRQRRHRAAPGAPAGCKAAPAAAGRAARAPRCARRCSASPWPALQRQLRELRGRNVEDGALRGARQRQRRGAGLGRLLRRRAEPRRRGRRRAGAAPAGLHPQALPVRAGDRRSGGSPRPRCSTTRRAQISTAERAVHPAELRPPLQGLCVGAQRAGGLAQRAGGAHPGDGVARGLRAASCARVGLPLREERRLLRLQPGAGQRRGVAAGAGATPTARWPTAGASARRAMALPRARRAAFTPGHRPARQLHRRRHPGRRQRPRRAPSASTACSPPASGPR